VDCQTNQIKEKRLCERIFEIEAVQKKLWDIIEGQPSQQTGPRIQVEACGKLLNCTQALTELYDAVPVVNAMGDYIEGKYYGANGFPRSNSNSNSNSNSYGVTGNGNDLRL